MVRKQRPGIAPHFALRYNLPQPLQEIIAILFIVKNLSTLDPTRNNMMQRPGRIYSGLSRHDPRLTCLKAPVNIKM
jgi:hypothetical protein